MDLLSHTLIGFDTDQSIIEGFTRFGVPLGSVSFAVRTDDLIAYQESIRAGLGIGFIADYVGRADNGLVPLLPMLKLPALPMWLAVHREIRTNRRIREVYDFLGDAVPGAL